MKKKIFILLLLLIGQGHGLLFAQINESDPINSSNTQADDDEEDDGKGIQVLVGIQPGLYLAAPLTSNYYNGTAKGLNGIMVIDRIFQNPETKRQIRDELGLSDTDMDGSYLDFNYDMNYEPGFLIGFQLYFGLTKKAWLLADINFVQLKASSVITLNVPDPNLPDNSVIQLPVFGKEERFIIDLAAHFILGKGTLKGYFEFGGNFLSAKVKENKFEVGDLIYDLLPTSNNIAANTITSFTFGGLVGGGIFIKASNNIALEAGLQIGYNNVKLPEYEGYKPNFLISLRFILFGKDSGV